MQKSSSNKLQNAAPPDPSTKSTGDAAELRALHHLESHGLQVVRRNYRTPGRGGGEIDLIMQDADHTLVFVEVRQRASDTHGGAHASVTWVKQRRIVFAAQYFLLRWPHVPACRFDVVLIEGDQLTWYRAAFELV